MKKNELREPYNIALSRISGEFIDKAMELGFLKAEWEERRRQLRIAMLVAGPAYFIGLVGDYLILGINPGFWVMVVFRSLVLLGAASVFYVAVKVDRISVLNAAILITELIIASSETLQLCFESRDLVEGFLMVGLVFVLFVPNRLFLTMFATISMSISCIAVLFMVELPSYHLSWVITFAVLFNFLSLYILRNRNQLQRQEYASRRQIVQAAQETADANEKLRASEERFRDFVTGVPIGFFRTTIDGHVIETNPAILKIVGFDSLEEARRYGWLNLYDDPEEMSGLLAAVLEKPVTGYEIMFRKPSGQPLPVRLHARVVNDEAGQPKFLDGALEDITEQKRAEQMIRESERRLADIIDFLPVATMVIDLNGKVTAWNRAMETITGVKSRDMIGKGDYEYALPLYGERRPILIDLVSLPDNELSGRYKNIHREGNILSGEAFIPKLSEKGSVLIGFASPLYGLDGGTIGAIESILDVTEIRQVEAELKEAKEAADAANKSKSAFLANMSHEIRTPMNAILGFARLMERDANLSSLSREHLEIINRSGEHLLALINDILEMSKIEAGRTTFVPKTFDLHDLIQDIEKMFRIRTDARGLSFQMEKVGQVPRWVVTDEGKLRQVLINLLGNAVKFTQEGGIVLRIAAAAAAHGEQAVQFEVQDTGPGIMEEEIGRLFQAFEQTRAGVKNGGTGLGLALSNGFVKILGGRAIEVTSTVGKGTTFRFSIPFMIGDEEKAKEKEARKIVLGLRPGQGEFRILIADDRETNRQLLSRLLEPSGFSIREAVNGEEALRAAREWAPRVILMDMTMPVMDGYEATRIIKSEPVLKDITVLALTASAFDEDRQRIFAAGADGYLSKPFREEELFESIRKLTGVEYLYQEHIAMEKTSGQAEGTESIRRMVASVDPGLVTRIRNAVASADLDLLEELALELAPEHQALAQRVRDLAVRYEYNALTALFSPE